jgi:hypothetical protein
MELVGYGREGEIRPVSPAEMIVERNRVEYRRGSLTEWYVNDRRGVEQGFTVQAPPPGSGRDQLALELSLAGSLIPWVNDQGDSMVLRGAAGATLLRYGGLRAFDAEGRDLLARLVLRDPATGEAYYYIVRAQHACTSTYGCASSDDERIPTSACD